MFSSVAKKGGSLRVIAPVQKHSWENTQNQIAEYC